MKVIILAGGTGTRLWPLSRTYYPKQFLKLNRMEQSLFQLTMNRCLQMVSLEDIYIVTNKEYQFLIAGQIEEMGYPAILDNILLEPQMKNTLPAIYNGVKTICKQGNDIVAVFSSDHLIGDDELFVSTISKCKNLAKDYLLTFGVHPTTPETGYGYIKPGKAIEPGYIVDEFKEKPDLRTAEQYIKSGYLWNSGMFMFDTALFISEVKKLSPEVYQAFTKDSIEECFALTPSISIDYGLMEKSDRVAVVPLTIQWSDLGSFAAFYEAYDDCRNEEGNVILNINDDVLINSTNNLISSDQDKTVVAIGVNDLVVIDQKDALLLCHKEQTQKVKDAVDILKKAKSPHVDKHLTEYRPWGTCTLLEESNIYKIRRLVVLPGKELSYHMHYHRSEHWIVVSGTATVTIDGEERIVNSNESIFVNKGSKHRFANRGKIPLRMIEVQTGDYLEDDDIVRFETQ